MAVTNWFKKNLEKLDFDFLKEVGYLFYGLNIFQIKRLRRMLQQKPLILAVETVSICNARCVFCAYPGMKRKHEVMPLDVFEKIIREYSQSGGGALSLTPVMGDPLIDPHFLERYKILERYQNINQISFTTNGIALGRFSDKELEYFLKRTFLIQFSMGGLDRNTYNRLYKVDKLDEVLKAVERILILRKASQQKTHIILAFRTDNPNFEQHYSQKLAEFREKGALISHIWTYNNYGGEIQTQAVKIKNNSIRSKKMTCALPLVHGHFYSNGMMTNCGCVDANGEGLVLGNVRETSIQNLWNSSKRQQILDSFSQGKPPQLCQDCTAYRPVTYLGTRTFKKIKSPHQLPLEFYLHFFGG